METGSHSIILPKNEKFDMKMDNYFVKNQLY